MSFEKYIQQQAILEQEKTLNEYDQKNFKNNTLYYTESGLSRMVAAVIDKNGDIQTDMINEVMEHLKNNAIDYKELISFYEDIYNSPDIDTIPVSTKVQNMALIEKIRPQYLSQFVTNIGLIIDKFLKGELSKQKVENIYMVDTYLLNFKKQMVKTSIPYDIDPKDLPKYNSSPIMDVNCEYITSHILPFLRNIPQFVRDLSIITANTISVIEKSFEDIQLYVDVVDKMLESGKISVDDYRFLNKFLYKMFRNFISLSSYLTFITIKKVSQVSLNIQTYRELQITITRYFPDGKNIIRENVMDGSFNDVDMASMVHDVLMNDNSIFRSTISTITSREKDKIVNLYGVMTGISDPRMISEKLSTITYPDAVYKNASNIFIQINKGLSIIENRIESHSPSFDSILEESRLNCDMIARFSNYVNAISNLDTYDDVIHGDDEENKRNASFMIFNELKDGIRNTDFIINKIYDVYELFLNLQKNSNRGNVDDVISIQVNDDLSDFLDGFDKNFRQLVLNVINALISRFKGLSQYIEELNKDVFPSSDISLIYSEDVEEDLDDILFESQMLMLEVENRHVFRELMKEYKSIRTFYETGMRVVYEEGENNTNNNNQSTGTGNKTLKDVGKDLITLIRNFFGKARKVVDDVITKQSSKNLPLLKAAKEPLNNLDYTGMVINVVPYEKYNNTNQMLKDIDTLIGNINKLNRGNIRKYKSSKNLNQFLFSFMEQNAASSDKFGEVMNTYYKTKMQPLQTVAYRGETAKQHVQLMCDYCIQFYESFGNSFKTKLDNLQKTLEAKINDLETMVESVVYEADDNSSGNQQPSQQPASQAANQQPNQNSAQESKPSVQRPTSNASIKNNNIGQQTDNVFNILKMLSTSVQQFTTGITRGARDRNFDYLKVLNSLIPQDVKDSVSGSTGAETEDNNTQEQQPQQQ